MLAAWLNRTILEVNVLHDRNPPFVLLSDGSIRNGYTVKILNKLHEPRTFTLAARGLAGRAARHRRRRRRCRRDSSSCRRTICANSVCS